MTNTEVATAKRGRHVRRAKAAALTGAGTLVALAPAGLTHASTPEDPSEAAAAAMDQIGTNTVGFINGPAMQNVVLVLGAVIVLGLVIRFGKRIGRT